MTTLKKPLFRHQKLALHYLRANDSFALFMDQGVGKTLPTLCHTLELYKQGKINNALVVAPKAVIGAWYRDMELFYEDDQEILTRLISLVSYDSVWRENKGFNKEWDLIIADESHKIKHRGRKRTKFLLRLALKSKYRYILTGTPTGNGQLENIFSQYAFLAPYSGRRGDVCCEWLGSYREFESKYCVLNQYWKPYRYLHVDELQDIIAEHSYRVKKNECLDLPEKLPDVIYDIDLMEPKLYKELAKSSTVEELDILAENPLAKLSKLRQVCSGFLNDGNKRYDLKCEKLAVLEEFLDGWDKKLVIFAEFTLSIHSISALLNKLKIKHVILNGEQKDKQIWRKFQEDDSIQIIICQYQSGSEGIDLFASDTVLYYEPTNKSNTLVQSRDRIHRSGQTQKCSYIHFITKGTVEGAIYKALKGYSDFDEKLFTEYMAEYTRTYSSKRR